MGRGSADRQGHPQAGALWSGHSSVKEMLVFRVLDSTSLGLYEKTRGWEAE